MSPSRDDGAELELELDLDPVECYTWSGGRQGGVGGSLSRVRHTLVEI